MQTCYIKSNVTKDIAPELFYPHKLQESGEINILQIKSCDNLADLFTKSLPTSVFQNWYMELVCGDFEICKNQAKTSPRCHLY